MKQWILKAGNSTLDALQLEDVPIPQPGRDQVRIRIHAVALNFRDHLVIQGGHWRSADKDIIPISDGAGVIDEVGSDVVQWRVGDRVSGLVMKDWPSGPPHPGIGMGLGGADENGMLAEYVVLPAARVARLPDSLDFAQAATLPCAGVTAWNALYGDHAISESSKVLVLGSGGVSLWAVQLAHAIGARVYATTSQDSKVDSLIALGANDVINYQDRNDWGKAVLEKTGGVDKVINSVGPGVLNESLMALAPGGEVAVLGLVSFVDNPLDPAAFMGKGANLRGLVVGSAQAYEDLVKAVDTFQIKPPIAKRFKLVDAVAAYEAQLDGKHFGKIIIEVT